MYDRQRILGLRRSLSRRSLSNFFLLVLLAAPSTLCIAQAPDHSSHAPGGPVPREILDRPVPLRTGIGSVHESVSTASPEAQSFYNQGLSYLHSFVWIEAIRSFHQSLRADPNLAMAYLGLADAYIGLQDVPTARSAVERARTFEKKLNQRERSWLAIRDAEVAFLQDAADPDSYVAYRKAVGDALKLNPADPWLWIQRGLADEASPFTHGQAGGVDTLAFYKTALALAPDNLPALHYYAHTCESIGRVKDALDLTATYARLAPAIPHAHHMHGHELLRTGRTEEAIQEFLKTKELEDRAKSFSYNDLLIHPELYYERIREYENKSLALQKLGAGEGGNFNLYLKLLYRSFKKGLKF